MEVEDKNDAGPPSLAKKSFGPFVHPENVDRRDCVFGTSCQVDRRAEEEEQEADVYVKGSEAFGPFAVRADRRDEVLARLSAATDWTSMIRRVLQEGNSTSAADAFPPVGGGDVFGPFPSPVDLYGSVQAFQELAAVLQVMFPRYSLMYLEELAVSMTGHGRELEMERLLYALNTDSPFLPESFARDAEAVSSNKRKAADCAEFLKLILPLADPEYLDKVGSDLSGRTDTARFLWMEGALQSKLHNIPTRKDHDKRKRMRDMLLATENNITPQQFLNIPGTPAKFYASKQRNVSDGYKRSCLFYLKREFSTIPFNTIRKMWRANNFLLYPSYRALSSCKSLKMKRSRILSLAEMPQDFDMSLMKEISYSRHERKLEKCFAQQRKLQELRYTRAVKEKSLVECKCCMDEEVLKTDIFKCEAGHGYCKKCLKQATTIALSEGNSAIKCLGSCDSVFSTNTLSRAIPPSLFIKWLTFIEHQKTLTAFSKGLVTCPRCSYFEVIEEARQSSSIFQCKNPRCQAEMCRLCGDEAHIPFECSEVGKDTKTARRLLIEDKMTEALLRKCNTCSKRFYKTDGCNKMTCVCGASQCYLCGKSVVSYDHFHAPGALNLGSKSCPLYSDNVKLMKEAMEKGAIEAKNILRERRLAVAEKTKGLKGEDERSFDADASEKDDALRATAEEVTVCNIF